MSNRCFELTAIDLQKEQRWLEELRRSQSVNPARDVDFEEDDLERPIPEAQEAPAPDADADLSNPPEGVYSPILVFENDIREIYPRRGNRSGTRIVYRSGAARPVKEAWEVVKAMFVSVVTEEPAAPARPSRSRSRNRPTMAEERLAASDANEG